MNPFFQTKTPTTKEMWKNEPNKFRQWMILLGIALVVFISLSVASIILVSLKKAELHDTLMNNMPTSIKNKSDVANKTILFNFIIIPVIMSALTLVGIVMYGITLQKSYKAQSFSKLSAFTIYFSEIIGFIALMNAIFTAYSSVKLVGNNIGAILSLVAQFFSILLLIFAWQVSRIRKTFIYAEKMEALQKSPEFQQMQNQMKTFFNDAQNGKTPSSAYGPTPAAPGTTTTAQAAPVDNEPAEVKELKKLKISELREIASKLSIAGSEKMTKDELVATIIRVTNQD